MSDITSPHFSNFPVSFWYLFGFKLCWTVLRFSGANSASFFRVWLSGEGVSLAGAWPDITAGRSPAAVIVALSLPILLLCNQVLDTKWLDNLCVVVLCCGSLAMSY